MKLYSFKKLKDNKLRFGQKKPGIFYLIKLIYKSEVFQSINNKFFLI